ncbi:MAG: hypothetical protein QM697_09570 [Lachnospiraceae bacterium]
MKRIRITFFAFLMVVLVGCVRKDDNHVQIQQEPSSYAETEETESEEGEEPEEPSAGLQRGEGEKQQNYIIIKAHVKEVYEDRILISSDSDSYPGAFEVTVSDKVYDKSKLSGGDFILIKLRGTGGNTGFDAVSLSPVDFFEESSQEDILLTEAPPISLSDLLSSTMNSFELRSGSYEWNYMAQNEMQSIIACGAHPLDVQPDGEYEKLDVPDYNKIDEVFYCLNCSIPPDIVTVRKWNSQDIGNTKAETVSTVTYYDNCDFVELQENMVYELNAEWSQDLSENRDFYGTASYFFVTE